MPHKLDRWGGVPLWEWGCDRCATGEDAAFRIEGGDGRAVVARARRHTRDTGHPTWVHNILMWHIVPA